MTPVALIKLRGEMTPGYV